MTVHKKIKHLPNRKLLLQIRLVSGSEINIIKRKKNWCHYSILWRMEEKCVTVIIVLFLDHSVSLLLNYKTI